jgi:hypothetical protein
MDFYEFETLQVVPLDGSRIRALEGRTVPRDLSECLDGPALDCYTQYKSV